MDLSIFRWDLDGVLKRLDIGALGREARTWDDTENGMDIVQHVNANLDILLYAPESEYLRPIDNLYRESGQTLRILTSQREHWKLYKERWLADNLTCDWEVEYSQGIQNKLRHMGADEYLIDDYPYFKNWNQILLVDRPYNRHVEVSVRICSPDRLISTMKRLSC
jgi:hypothetical protein